MPQSDRNSQRENKQRGNEPSFNWRGVILIAVAFGFFALAMLFWRGNYPQLEDVPYNRFLELVENKQIVNDKNAPLTLYVEEGQAYPRITRQIHQARHRRRAERGRAVSHRYLSQFHQQFAGQTHRRWNSTEYPLRITSFWPGIAELRAGSLSARSLFSFPPANPHGRQRRAQLRQIESAHARA